MLKKSQSAEFRPPSVSKYFSRPPSEGVRCYYPREATVSPASLEVSTYSISQSPSELSRISPRPIFREMLLPPPDLAKPQKTAFAGRPYSPYVSAGQVLAKQAELRSRWAELLANHRALTPMPSLLPEDGTLAVHTFHMAVAGNATEIADFSPFMNIENCVDVDYVENMANICGPLGIRLLVHAPAQHASTLSHELIKSRKLQNCEVVALAYCGSAWLQDSGDFTIQGKICIPAPSPWMDHSSADVIARISNIIYHDRIRRLYDCEPDVSLSDSELRENYPEAYAFAVQGAVCGTQSYIDKIALALAGNFELTLDLGHVEGGNRLSGRRADGSPYAIVGADSIALSLAIMRSGGAPDATFEDAKHAVACSSGVSDADLIVVEQPGDFHLDTRMKLMPNGVVLLNDAMAVCNLSEKVLRKDHESRRPPSMRTANNLQKKWQAESAKLEADISTMRETALLMAALEARTDTQLRAAGLTVHRIAGCFQAPYGPMNFLNSVSGIAPTGEHFFITQGGHNDAVIAFMSGIDPFLGEGDVLYFLDEAASINSLTRDGGAACRMKAEGRYQLPGTSKV